ncbi:hypothetical protein [Paenibacillus qinlingensis]|uniref:hypothetical protein n=1 Tax=Paenibacillus qinlingensis TaxID=1837343 RepID=UPI00286DF277|nr:hypothetical protein [Paenibacillus qinlingensis]
MATRKGRTNYGTSGGAITRLLANFGNTHLVRGVGTQLEYNSAGTTWTNIGGTWANADWDYTNFDIMGPALILVNGVNPSKYWTGSTLIDIPQMPVCKYVASDNRRVYTANKAGDLDTVFFCAFQNALDWTTLENSGFVQYYTANGGPITGLHAFQGQIWIFKRDSYAILFHTGDSRATHRLVEGSNDIGCVQYRTIVEVDELLIWLGADDVYVGAGGAAKAIGQPIRGVLQNINFAAIENACAWTDDHRYYLCVPTGANTQPDTELVYDTRYRKWHIRNIALGGLRYAAVLNSGPFAGDASGQTFKLQDGYTDAGATINWQVTTRPYYDGVMEAEKELYEMHIQGLINTGTSLTVHVSPEAERDDAWLLIDTQNTTAADNVTQNRNLIVPLDVVPLTNFYRYRLTGTALVEIQQVQRYSRIQPVQH